MLTLLLVTWLAPRFWFRSPESGQQSIAWRVDKPPVGWLSSTQTVAAEVSVSLGAKVLYAGTLSPEGGGQPLVRVFLAERGGDAVHGSSFFSHTPDRCWPASGWRLESCVPEQVGLKVQGRELMFERRVFSFGRVKELVYFAAIVGGHPYMGRMDHYMDYAERTAVAEDATKVSRLFPRVERRSLDWIRSVIRGRTRLDGTAQFLRVSTAVLDDRIEDADQALRAFLAHWPSLAGAP